VHSIVGRFLEHSRIFRFGTPERGVDLYIGSADLMPRNLDHRVEALVPVTDPGLRQRIDDMLELELSDDVLAWRLGPDGVWRKVPTDRGVNAQERLMSMATERARADR
jgi:polyphosphate kinase